MPLPLPALLGVDFSSAPHARKPITVARGRLVDGGVRLEAIDALPTLAAFEAVLAEPGPWVGGFDFPFGLPRDFVESQALGQHIAAVVAEVKRRAPSRMAFRAWVDGWTNGRAPGQRLIHRRTDTAEPGVSSSSPLQTRYVPVGFMFYEGASRLLHAGVSLPGLHEGDPRRIALEAYPGLLAQELIGRRSYKNADIAERREARAAMLAALQCGRTRLALRLMAPRALQQAMLDDAGGDRLDALLCLMQAAWASVRPGFGQPADVDPVEGWIVSAGAPR